MTQNIDLDSSSRGDMKHMIRLLMKQVETLENHVKKQDIRTCRKGFNGVQEELTLSAICAPIYLGRSTMLFDK